MPIGPQKLTEGSESVGMAGVTRVVEISHYAVEEPKYTFDDLVLPEGVKQQLMDAITYRDTAELVFEQWGLKETHKFSRRVAINLYGDPGTGKTMAAHACAFYLGRKLMIVNYADIESKYVGDTSKNLVALFEKAKTERAILFFDEADAMLSKRVTNMASSTDVSVNQTRSVLLMLLNDYQDVVFFATNFLSNIDPAFIRRILTHIHFQLPDEQQRIALWRKLIPGALPTNLDVLAIARDFDGISGSDISNAVLNAALSAARNRVSEVDKHYFYEAIHRIRETKKLNRTADEGHAKVMLK